MTSEKRILVSLADIKLICCECKECGARLSFNPDRAIEIPQQCLQCNFEWRKQPPTSVEPQRPTAVDISRAQQPADLRLTQSIADLRKQDIANALGFRLLLEFNEPRTGLEHQGD
jgi:hypothetical protein